MTIDKRRGDKTLLKISYFFFPVGIRKLGPNLLSEEDMLLNYKFISLTILFLIDCFNFFVTKNYKLFYFSYLFNESFKMV
jgi:hypothetical protein